MANTQILLVEDEGIVAKDIQSMLRDFGYGVSGVVTSGEEAIKTAAETQPDLVLMDIGLRGKIDGIEAAKQIRDRFSIPVVFLTAYADESTLKRAKMTQPFDIILKPIGEIELRAIIKKALYEYRLEGKPE